MPTSRGTAATSANSISAIIGTVTSTQNVIDRARPRGEHAVLRSLPAVRQQPEEGGADPVVEVGDARQVRQHVVAVEPQERQQLLRHLQDLDGDQQQERFPPRGPPPHEGEHRDDRVEVQAAEVGAEAAAPVEPVAVGDVGEERRPHQVETGAHHAGIGAAVASRRCVPELMEATGEHRDDEHEHQEVRALERVVRRGAEPALEEDPAHDRDEAEHHHRDDQRPEQHPERVGQPTGRAGVGDGEPRLEAQQRVGPLELGVRAVGRPDQAERAQVLVDQGRTSAAARVRPSAGPTTSAISA